MLNKPYDYALQFVPDCNRISECVVIQSNAKLKDKSHSSSLNTQHLESASAQSAGHSVMLGGNLGNSLRLLVLNISLKLRSLELFYIQVTSWEVPVDVL